jgi:D-alanine-D-alanine ligase
MSERIFRTEPVAADRAAIDALVAATGFFSAAERAVAVELVDERLRRGDASGYCFLLAGEASGRLHGYCCYGRVPCTRGAHDLYWIVVGPEQQRQGLGRELVARTAAAVVQQGGCRLYAETSGRPQYAPTRAFYARAGFRCEATLADFYAPGDDKLIYVLAPLVPDAGVRRMELTDA